MKKLFLLAALVAGAVSAKSQQVMFVNNTSQCNVQLKLEANDANGSVDGAHSLFYVGANQQMPLDFNNTGLSSDPNYNPVSWFRVQMINPCGPYGTNSNYAWVSNPLAYPSYFGPGQQSDFATMNPACNTPACASVTLTFSNLSTGDVQLDIQ